MGHPCVWRISLANLPPHPKFEKVGSFIGKDMVGWRYQPMFDYFTEQARDLQRASPSCMFRNA